MKKIIFLVMLLCLLFLASCGRSTPSNGDENASENIGGSILNESPIQPLTPTQTPTPPHIASQIVAPSMGVNILEFSNPFGLPETPHGGNILHTWNMTFVEIIEHLPYIAQAGFGVIQTSPIGASLVRSANMGTPGRWYDLYQPTAFSIGNYLGTEEQFRELTRAAATFGIYIIVDAIPNHTTAYWNEIDPALRDHYPSLFHSRHGDRVADNPWRAPMDFGNRRSFVRSNLLGLWDFYTSRPEFQEIYMQFLGNIIDAGASGFRFDAAHHIELPNDPPDIASDFWPIISTFVNDRVTSLNRIPFQYGEVLGGGYRQNHYVHALFELANYRVSSYAFSRHILGTVDSGFLIDGQDGWNSTNFHIHGNPISNADSFFGPAFTAANLGGYEGVADATVPWVESHDQYGNTGMSRHLTNEQILVGWALITARQGTSPLFLVRPGVGFINSGTIFVRQPDGLYMNVVGHNTFYRDPAVAAINWFANDFINYPEATSTHGNVAVIQRGPENAKTGAVIVNAGAHSVPVTFPVQMLDGIYTCDITGDVFIVSDGWLTRCFFTTDSTFMPRRSVVVLRNRIDLPDAHPPIVRIYPSSANEKNFTCESGITVTLIALSTEHQYFSVTKNGDVIIPVTAFTHGQQITIGENAEVGDEFVLIVEGENTVVTTDSETHYHLISHYTFIRQELPSQIRVEYVRNENPWETAAIWAWNSRGDVFTGGWPGPAMEWLPRLDGEGYAWVFYLPPDTAVPVSLIFNNSGQGQQTTPYLVIAESTRVFQIGDGVTIGNAESLN